MADPVIVVDSAPNPVIVVDTRPEFVVVSGIQGPPGPQGPIGPAGDAPTLIAGITVSGHRAIAIDANGEGVYADAGDASAMSLYGISTNAALLGEDILVARSGYLEWPAGGLTPGAPLFLGTTGLLTQTVPTTGWLRQVATAIDAASVIVDIGPGFYLGN